MSKDIRDEGVLATHDFNQGREGGSIPTSSLQLKVVEVSVREAREFNRRWHSLLPRTDYGNLLAGRTSVAYAAIFDGIVYAVAIWSQPIARSIAANGHTIELRRMAISDDAPKNTASRMISIMRKLVKQKYPEITKAVSYLAIDVHSGTIYKASGWKPSGKIVDARPQRVKGSRQRATGPLQTTSRKQRWEIEI